MRWLFVICVVLLLAGCETETLDSFAEASDVAKSAAPRDAKHAATLRFVVDGKTVKTFRKSALMDQIDVKRVSGFDPYYSATKTFRALAIERVLELGFGERAGALQARHFVLRASDGYEVPIDGSRLLEPGGYLAVADVDVPGWQPIGAQAAHPGPFYLFWENDNQRDLVTHPRPWQLATIEISRFESSYPHTVPAGAAADSAAMKGFALFREQCIRCHAVNREGGKIGPDLNVPRSIVDYRPEQQIRAYIRDPASFRFGNMPSNPHLSDADLDALLAYLKAMSEQKIDVDSTGGH